MAAEERTISASEDRGSTMNAIILSPEIEARVSSLASTTPVPKAEATVGWTIEAERSAQDARRHERESLQ